MSSTNKYNTTYSAADIEKYLRGELSPREMHDLEDAALEDPFLADALDGMSVLLSPPPAATTGQPDTITTDQPGIADDTGPSRDLEELHTRLNARVTAGPDRNKILRLVFRWSIAASIILLLGIGYAIYYTSFTGTRSPAVASSPLPAEAATPPNKAVSPSEAVAPPKETTSPAEGAASPKETPPIAKANAPVGDTSPAEPPSLAKATAPAAAKSAREEDKEKDKALTGRAIAAAPTDLLKNIPKAIPPPNTDAETKKDTITGTYATADIGPKLSAASSHQLDRRVEGLRIDSTRNTPAGLAAKLSTDFSRQPNSLVYKGTVLDNHNNPVQGASLTLKGYTNTGTVTDQQGQFSLHLRPQDSTRYLTVAMIGYEQRSLPLNTLIGDAVAGHVIHLQPNEASLDEVVVTGYGSKRKETIAEAPSTIEEGLDSLWLNAYPVIGRSAYLHYLDTAQKALAFDSTFRGTETVSFEVDKKGTLTAFKIEQSLSPTYDEAIIRLVKEGSAWQLLRQKKARVLVSLHF